MNNNLEDFANRNREAFDGENPSAEIWNKIDARLHPAETKHRVAKIAWLKWSVAAAIIVVIAASALYLLTRPVHEENIPESVAGSNEPARDSLLLNEINPAYAKELYHFARIIEIKQEELKQLEKENPSLYKEFIGDINSLDSSYNQLKTELTNNPNREQLLEAMISNLQIQMNLLNQQLQVIQQIKQSKNTGNESNHKNI